MRPSAAIPRLLVPMLLASVSLDIPAQDNARSCTEPEGSTFRESCVLQQEAAAASMKLQDLLSERLKNPVSALDLRASQAAWERFRDATCQWQQVEYGGLNSINAVRCVAALTAQRVRYFEELP